MSTKSTTHHLFVSPSHITFLSPLSPGSTPSFRTALSVANLLSALGNQQTNNSLRFNLRQRFKKPLLNLRSIIRFETPVPKVEQGFARQRGHDGAASIPARQQAFWPLLLRVESYEARRMAGFGVTEYLESGEFVGGGVALGWEGGLGSFC